MKSICLSLILALSLQIASAQSITEGNNSFAINLLHQLSSNTENVFYSPYSISTALFMTTGGAKSETEKQMLKVLCQTENSLAYHKKFAENLALIEKKEKIQLNIANSIWMQKGFKFHQPYLDLLNTAYKAKLNECNFSVNPDAEAKKINKWVEGKTKDKIKNLIAPGILKPNTKMVLVNAIYFYGGWNKEFDKDETRDDDFILTDNAKIKVPFMNAEYKMKYVADDEFEVLSVPYMKNEASMMIFLPKTKGNIGNAAKLLTFEKYKALSGKLNEYKVNLQLPKFSMTSQFELSKTLSEMGMPLPFSLSADFSGMSSQDELKIDKVIHKAFVEVSEKGTEAAGATAVIMTTKSAMPDKEKIIYFRADHPFIFMIKDNASGQILFIGILNKPQKQ